MERSGLFARLRRRLHSPLARLHLAHLLACAASHEARYLDEAKVEVASLFDHTEEHRRWKTFRAILEWTRRSFQTYHDFRQLDAATKLTLVWLHAGRLQNTLERANARDAAIDRAFLTAGEAFGIVSDSHDFPFWHDAAHPRCAGRLPVLLCGLGAAFRTLPLDLAAELRTQVAPWSNAGEAVTASAFLLLRDTMLGRNSLNSFLGGDTFVLLRSAVAEDTLATMLPHPPQDVLRSTLTELATSPNNTHLWQLLAATAADYPLPEDLEPILERLLLETDFLKLLHVDTAAEHFILQFIAARQAVTQSSVSSDRIEQATFSFAQRYAKEPMSEEDVRRRVGMLAGCLLCLAVIPSDEAASHGRFHKFLVRLLHEWPKAAPVLRSRFDGWPTRLPPSRQNGVWELEMTLRAIR